MYHRSYEEREPIEVQVTPSEITILSFPGPDITISMEDLRAGKAVARRYRNRRIGEFLKELELSEGRGTGIPKVLDSMRANGSPEPQFETDPARTSFLVRLPLRQPPPPTATGPVPPAHITAQQVNVPLTVHVLAACNTPLRAAELQVLLNWKDRISLIQGVINPLIDAGLISRTRPDAPKSPLQKYVTTEQGKLWLADHSE